jgi:hypothetical protein
MSYRFEGGDIVIDGVESGIADTPFATNLQTAVGTIQRSGLGDMRNMNIISIPGEASVNFKSQPIQQTAISSVAYTVDTNGLFTSAGAVPKVGTRITLNTLTGGTSSLTGINMAGNNAAILSMETNTNANARVIASNNGLAGVSAIVNIGFLSNPSNGDWIFLNINNANVIFKFVSVIGATAGNVLIGANTAATIVNLLGLLNAPGTTNATQVALSAANQTIVGYYTNTSTTVSVGLFSGGKYTVTATTGQTFTLTTNVPNAAGQAVTYLTAMVVPTSGSGTFSTTGQQMALLTQIVPNSSNTAYYGIDTNGAVWVYPRLYSSTWMYLGNTVTAASTPDFNTGIAVWNNYIIAFYDGPSGYQSYTCSISLVTPTWTAFKALLGRAVPHRTFQDINATLYWCDGSSVGSLIQLTTFDPTSSSTYVWTQDALPILPTGEVLQCIEQLGNNLLLGGSYNAIYSWNKTANDANPIFIPENNVHRMVTVNSNTYFFAGNRGRIYVTNGANAQLYKKVPDHLSNTIEPTFLWGGATYNKNQLYFSVSAFTSNVSTETAIPNYGGIWAIDTNTDAMRLTNKLSYDTYGGYTAEMCGMIANTTSTSGLNVQNFGLVCGWEDSTETASPTYGSDVLPVNSFTAIANTPYTNYESYIDSDMIPVGTYLNPTTDANVEFKLTVPMVAGEGVKLAYRQDLSQSFTDITNGEFTTAGTFSGVTKVNFQKSQWLQIRCYTKSTATTPSFTRLKELRIRQ